jgi:hypothetical protein
VVIQTTSQIFLKGFNLIFKISVALHGKQAQESSVLIDTIASEKNITYPTDANSFWHCFVGEKNDYYTLFMVLLFFEFGINNQQRYLSLPLTNEY